MSFRTADLCDATSDVEICDPIFRAFGERLRFAGPIKTLKVYEDNSLVREMLETEGEGHVLVVDGGGSHRCALLGDRLAQLVIDNNWAGVVIYGCIRDSAVIDEMDVGVRAVGTCPKKSVKTGMGHKDLTLRFGGIQFKPGHHLYADEDGVILAPRLLV